MSLPAPPLLVITDRHPARLPLPELAGRVFAAGCRWLFLRERDLEVGARAALLERLIALGRVQGAWVLVGDPESAAEAGAAGVHLPRDADVAATRRRLGAGAFVGYSAHDLAEAQRAAAQGADYVTLSPVFASAGKPASGPPLGLGGLAELAARSPIPVLALGGVTPENAAGCLAAGAAGVAVMGAVMRAEEPGTAVAALLAALRRAPERRG